MAIPSTTQYFEAAWTSATPPTDPSLFTAAEIVAGTLASGAVSTATSAAVSTINAAAPDSVSISQARSQAVSAASIGSIADSKAVSGSLNTSTVDSKTASGSQNTSIADSKAVSVGSAVPVTTAIVYSANISIADSKATSTAAVTQSYPRLSTESGASVLTFPYGDVRRFGADVTGAADATSAFANCMTSLGAVGGGLFSVPMGAFLADPPALAANVTVRGAGKSATTITAATITGAWNGTDVSNVRLEGFTFIGRANNGSSGTDHAVFIRASASDVTDIKVIDCAFRQFKSTDSCVRIAGNGDLVTPATKFVKRVIVADCTVSEYYDTDPTNVGVAAHGIYFFGGVKEIWCQRNYVEGTNGKIGIIAQSEANDVHIEDNIVVNCGQANVATPFGYGITVYSSYTTVSVVDAFISRNTVVNTTRAGIYLAAIGKFIVNDNILDTCDTASLGLGNIATGAIQVNNNVDNAANGMGTVVGNTIIDPGFCALYINNGSFGRSNCTVTGNSCRVQTLTLDRTGVVYTGRGTVIIGNEFRGFRRNVFLYNTADNIVGDCTISDNEFDSTGVSGALIGITCNSFTFILNPMVITGNRFKACGTGVDIRSCTDLAFSDNVFAGAAAGTHAILLGMTRGTISNNIADSGTLGLQLGLKAATATARATVSGNLMTFCTTACIVTENTGQIMCFGNDFGTQPGRAADQGDANIASALNNPTPEVFPFSTTLTGNRTATLSTTRAFRGDKKTIVRDAGTPGAFTLALINDLGATLATIPSNTKGFATAVFDGTNWKSHSSGTYA